jgi:hypothetical protein
MNVLINLPENFNKLMINNIFQLLQTNQAKTLQKKYYFGMMKATVEKNRI